MHVERCPLCHKRIAKSGFGEVLWFLNDGRTVHLECLEKELKHYQETRETTMEFEPVVAGKKKK